MTGIQFASPLSAQALAAYSPRVLPSFDAPSSLPSRVLPSFDTPRVIPLLDDPRVLPSFDVPSPRREVMPLAYFSAQLDASTPIVESSPIFDALDREWVAEESWVAEYVALEALTGDDWSFAEDDDYVIGDEFPLDPADSFLVWPIVESVRPVTAYGPLTVAEVELLATSAVNGAGFLEVAWGLISQQRLGTLPLGV